jgi:hypothetical protein
MEDSMKDAILNFARAVFWGSVAGGGPFLLITLSVSLGAPHWWQLEVIWLAFFPIVIAAAVVTLASVVLGLPLTIWLARRKDERATTYAVAGLGLGAMLPIAVSAGFGGDGAFLALPGAMAGTTTGAIWGCWREKCRDQFDEPAATAEL